MREEVQLLRSLVNVMKEDLAVKDDQFDFLVTSLISKRQHGSVTRHT